jgi:hypothetical protein
MQVTNIRFIAEIIVAFYHGIIIKFYNGKIFLKNGV